MRQGVKQNIKLNKAYFLTPTVVHWIDLFSRHELRQIIIESLKYCIDNKGLNVFAFCIMTNHMHLVVNCEEPFQLKDTIRDFKRHTATSCYQWIIDNKESRKEWMIPIFQKAGNEDPKNKNIKIWQTGNNAIELYNEHFTWTKILYTHLNPVRAEWVTKPEDWKYSSASNYVDSPSILPDVVCLKPPVNYGL